MARQPKSVVDAARRTKGADDPSTPSLFYQSMTADWGLISTVLGGTRTMRAAGKALLPQHEGEGDTRYRDRLTSAVLTNYTGLTLDYWVGKPFSKQVALSKDSDPDVAALADDINLNGDDMTVVCKDWFTKGLSKQVAYCLVEFPEVPDHLKGRVTLADQKRLNLRPYWVIIPAEAMLAAPKERINGEDKFMSCRFYDNEIVQDGFVEKVQQRIREFRRTITRDPETNEITSSVVEQRLHYKIDRNKWEAKSWKTISLEEIPLVEFNTGKLELEGLIYLNITHYQSSSDQRNCLTTARFPILAASGVAADTVVTIGPYAFLAAKDASSKFYYVEHTGSALSAGQVDIDKLVEDMALYGAEMLKQRPDRETATSRVLDAAEATAPLQVHVFSFMSSVNQALYYTAQWMDKPDETVIRVEMNTDFAMSKETSAKIDNLKELRKSGDISRKQFLGGMIEAKALPESFDQTANDTELLEEATAKAKAAAEAAKLLAQASPTPDPAKPDGKPPEKTQ